MAGRSSLRVLNQGAADVLGRLNAAVDASARRGADADRIPCGRGCNSCCMEFAIVHVAEAMSIAAAIDEHPRRAEIVARFGPWLQQKQDAGVLFGKIVSPERVVAAATFGFIPTAHLFARVMCPLNDPETGDCMVYADRPSACRGHYVLDVTQEQCASHIRGGPPEIVLRSHFGESVLAWMCQTFGLDFLAEVGEAVAAFFADEFPGGEAFDGWLNEPAPDAEAPCRAS